MREFPQDKKGVLGEKQRDSKKGTASASPVAHAFVCKKSRIDFDGAVWARYHLLSSPIPPSMLLRGGFDEGEKARKRRLR